MILKLQQQWKPETVRKKKKNFKELRDANQQ